MFKVCRSCGQEYQSWVSVCPDCDTPLDLAPGETLAPTTRAVAALVDLVLLTLGEPRDLQALAQALQAHGISSQIDAYPLGQTIGRAAGSRGQPARLGIYVARADLAAVREIAAELAARNLPDADAGVAHDPTACPACGEPTPENAAACSSCGLEFPEVGTVDTA